MSLTWLLVFEVFLIGVSLSMDALAVSVTDGLCYRNLTKLKGISISATFGFFQAVMPIIGFFVAYGLGQVFSELFDAIDHWIAFLLLFIIGVKMIIDAVKEFRSKDDEVREKGFKPAEVLLQGVATSIDALFVGVSFAATDGLKDSIPNVLVSVLIIGVVTFIISIAGVFVGARLGKALNKKAGYTEVAGGLILIAIGLKILIQGLI